VAEVPCLAAFPDPFPGVLRAAWSPLLQGFNHDASAIVGATPEASILSTHDSERGVRAAGLAKRRL